MRRDAACFNGQNEITFDIFLRPKFSLSFRLVLIQNWRMRDENANLLHKLILDEIDRAHIYRAENSRSRYLKYCIRVIRVIKINKNFYLFFSVFFFFWKPNLIFTIFRSN